MPPAILPGPRRLGKRTQRPAQRAATKAWSLANTSQCRELAQIHREQMRKLEARLSEQQPVTKQQAQELGKLSAKPMPAASGQELKPPCAKLSRRRKRAERFVRNTPPGGNRHTRCWQTKSAEMANSGAVGPTSKNRCVANSTSCAGNAITHRGTAEPGGRTHRVRAERPRTESLVQLESVSARTESEAREISQARAVWRANSPPCARTATRIFRGCAPTGGHGCLAATLAARWNNLKQI